MDTGTSRFIRFVGSEGNNIITLKACLVPSPQSKFSKCSKQHFLSNWGRHGLHTSQRDGHRISRGGLSYYIRPSQHDD